MLAHFRGIGRNHANVQRTCQARGCQQSHYNVRLGTLTARPAQVPGLNEARHPTSELFREYDRYLAATERQMLGA